MGICTHTHTRTHTHIMMSLNELVISINALNNPYYTDDIHSMHWKLSNALETLQCTTHTLYRMVFVLNGGNCISLIMFQFFFFLDPRLSPDFYVFSIAFLGHRNNSSICTAHHYQQLYKTVSRTNSAKFKLHTVISLLI